MKRLIAILLCTVALLVLACEDPKEPTCPLPGNPEATETVTLAVWNPAVAAHYIYADKVSVVDEPAHTEYRTRQHSWSSWGQWRDGTCPGGTGTYCEERSVTATYEYVCPVGYSNNPHHSNCRKLVPEVPGYWIDPVCKVPDAPPDMCKVEGLEGLLASDPLCVEPVIPPTPEVCKPISYMWHQCNTGNWTYTPGGSADKCWCGGLNGSRVVKESYDCGRHWTYYLDGERTTQDFSWLGFYKAPACAIGGWCAK